MTDLKVSMSQTDLNSNIYFQNKRIRRYLIEARLINRKGDILPPVSSRASFNQPIQKHGKREPFKNISKSVDSYIIKQEKITQTPDNKKVTIVSTRIDSEKKLEPKETCQKRVRAPRASSSGKKKNSMVRPKSAHYLSKNRKLQLRRRSLTPEKVSKEPEARVTMIYYGQSTYLDQDNKCKWFHADGDEIVVAQQHCGGENLIVFKKYVKPNRKFSFVSRRHEDYPFALSFYVNGLINIRISTCCEYRHKRNKPLGGKQGLFGIVDVVDARACPNCRQSKRVKKPRPTTAVTTVKPARLYKSSFPPDFLTKSRSLSPDPEVSTASWPKAIPKSPIISRTPSSSEDENESHTNSSDPKKPTTPIRQKSDDETKPAPLQNNNGQYDSDFDGNNDDDSNPENLRFGRPHISESNSTDDEDPNNNILKSSGKSIRSDKATVDNKPSKSSPKHYDSSSTKSSLSSSSEDLDHFEKVDDEDEATESVNKDIKTNDSPRSSPKPIKKPDRPTDEENDFLTKILGNRNNAALDSQKTSTTMSKKSDFLQDEPDYRQSRRSNDVNNPLYSSTNSARKSGLFNDEDDFFLTNPVSARSNTAVYTRKNSSTDSEKSSTSPRYHDKGGLNDATTYNRFSSTKTFKNTTEDQQYPSNSQEVVPKTLVSNRSQEPHQSSNAQNMFTNSSDDMFDNKKPSLPSANERHASALNDDWFKTSDRTDSHNNKENDFNRNFETTSWRRHNSDDDD